LECGHHLFTDLDLVIHAEQNLTSRTLSASATPKKSRNHDMLTRLSME